jgi:two-component system sensor histidine kinase YesM
MKTSIQAGASKRSVHSLKRKTWQFFLIILSVFCVIFVASYSIIIVRAAVDNEISQSEIALTSTSKNLKVSLDRYKEMSRLIMINSNVVSFLRDSGNGNAYNTTKVVDGIFSVTNIYSFVDSVYIYRLDGACVSTGSGVMLINERLLSALEWTAPIREAKGGSVTMINGNGAFRKKTGLPLITMGRLIYDIDKQQAIGTLFVHLTPSVLSAATRNLGMDRTICFLDEEGNVLEGD